MGGLVVVLNDNAMSESINPVAHYYQSDYGNVWLSPWLGERADRLPVRRDGQVDMRFRSARKFFARLESLAKARYMAALDG